MFRRPPLGLVLALASLVTLAAQADAPLRIVSLNPSLTSILIAVDARQTLVGVDDWSARVDPRVAGLPQVGGLFNPSLETIVGLQPDLVVLVPSAQQRTVRARLKQLGIEVLVLRNITLEELLDSIETLGRVVDRETQARARVEAIRESFAASARETATGERPRTVLVIQRDPLYVVGSGSFLDSMLAAAGTRNVAGALEEAYPRVGVEWLIAAAPELILDASGDLEPPERYWSRWPSLPAVASGRVVALDALVVTLPGADLNKGLRYLMRSIHGRDAAREDENTR